MNLSIKYKTIALLLAVAVSLTACGGKPAESDTTAKASESTKDSDAADEVHINSQQFKAAGVRLAKIQNRTIEDFLKVNGMLEVPPQNAITVAVPYGGIVTYTSALEGKRVAKGERLISLESPEFIILQQNYLDSKSQLEFAEVEYQRQQDLSDKQINARKTLQRAKADYISLSNRVQGLKAQLALLNLSIKTLEKKGVQQSVNIYSPMEGTVTEVNITRGSYVSANTMMFRIIKPEAVYAELQVFEKDISSIKIGQTVKFSLASDTTMFPAEVALIGREIDKDRSVKVHAKIVGKVPDNMVSGMYLKAYLETYKKEVPALPDPAVVSFEGKDYVFYPLDNNQKFKMLQVRSGASNQGYTEVQLPDAVPENTPFVIQGAYQLLSIMKNSDEEE